MWKIEVIIRIINHIDDNLKTIFVLFVITEFKLSICEFDSFKFKLLY